MSLPATVIPVPKIEDDCYDWYERHAEKLQQVSHHQYDIILLGDSITHFWEPGPHTRGENTWPKFFAGRNVLNLGFGWDRTQNVLWRLEHGEMNNQHPQLLILNIGTNNLGESIHCRTFTPHEIAQGVAAVVAKLRELAPPQAQIVVMCPFPRGNGQDQFVEKVPATAQEIKKILSGQPNLALLNLAPALADENGGLLPELTPDTVHLNGLGYRIWGTALLPYLNQVK